ncbi:MAG: response regulator transcription factor, partial [Pseudomonadota bacterium]|nr:response regulator transcription factor [Pseudomonadota bacterium]
MHPNVLIVEDAEIANLLTLELGRLGYTMSTAATGADALKRINGAAPDLVLLDLGLPDIDGYEILRELRETRRTLPVICLTARDQQMDRIGGLRAGADDYIVKPFDVGELDARLRAVLRRSGRVGAQDVSIGALRLLSEGMQVEADGQPVPLTPRELHVLRRLIKNVGRVVTKQQLTETLSQLNEDIGEKTIEVYIHRLRTKLTGHGLEIVTVRGFGYLLRALPTR